jgi:hypothetical protein
MGAWDRDDRLLFPEDVLVAYGNRLLEEAGTVIRITSVRHRQNDHYVLDAATPSGTPVKLYAPTCEFAPGLIGFRSLLRVVDASKVSKWLGNGQASRNVREVIFHGEQGPRMPLRIHRS